MAKKRGILSALLGGAGSKKSGSSRASKSASSKSKNTASKSKSKIKTAPKRFKSKAGNAAPKIKTPTPKKTSDTSLKAKKPYKKPLALVPVGIKDYRDKKGGHPHVIIEDIEDKHVSVGLTKDKYKGRNATNYKCEVSPLGDGKQSYMRRQAQVEPRKDYYNPRNGKMDAGDYERAKVYGERAKQKYLQKKDKKNSNEVPNA